MRSVCRGRSISALLCRWEVFLTFMPSLVVLLILILSFSGFNHFLTTFVLSSMADNCFHWKCSKMWNPRALSLLFFTQSFQVPFDCLCSIQQWSLRLLPLILLLTYALPSNRAVSACSGIATSQPEPVGVHLSDQSGKSYIHPSSSFWPCFQECVCTQSLSRLPLHLSPPFVVHQSLNQRGLHSSAHLFLQTVTGRGELIPLLSTCSIVSISQIKVLSTPLFTLHFGKPDSQIHLKIFHHKPPKIFTMAFLKNIMGWFEWERLLLWTFARAHPWILTSTKLSSLGLLGANWGRKSTPAE